jgi:hypothetical protein
MKHSLCKNIIHFKTFTGYCHTPIFYLRSRLICICHIFLSGIFYALLNEISTKRYFKIPHIFWVLVRSSLCPFYSLHFSLLFIYYYDYYHYDYYYYYYGYYYFHNFNLSFLFYLIYYYYYFHVFIIIIFCLIFIFTKKIIQKKSENLFLDKGVTDPNPSLFNLVLFLNQEI